MYQARIVHYGSSTRAIRSESSFLLGQFAMYYDYVLHCYYKHCCYVFTLCVEFEECLYTYGMAKSPFSIVVPQVHKHKYLTMLLYIRSHGTCSFSFCIYTYICGVNNVFNSNNNNRYC